MVHYTSFAWIVNGLLTVIIAIGGIIGNSYSVYLLHTRYTVSNTSAFYSKILACWDVLLLVSAFCYYGFADFLAGIIQGFPTIFEYMGVAFHPLCSITMTGAVWMLVVIASDRLKTVLDSPRRFRRDQAPARRASLICFAVGGSAVLYNVPAFFELQILYCKEVESGVLVDKPYVDATDIRTNKFYMYAYRIFCDTVFKSLGPFLIILGMSIVLLRKIIAAIRQRDSILRQRYTVKSRRKRKTEITMTSMLLGLLLKFLLTSFLPTAINIWEIFVELGGIIWASYIIDISNFLIVFNSATDWMVYFYFIKKSKIAIIRAKYGMGRNSFKSPKNSKRSREDSTEDQGSRFFTEEEAESIRGTWPVVRIGLGSRLTLEMLKSRPNLSILVGILHFKPNEEISTEARDRLNHKGEEIERFFDFIISRIGNPGTELEILNIIHKTVKIHYERGIEMDGDLWKVLKTTFLQQVQETLSQDPITMETGFGFSSVLETSNGYTSENLGETLSVFEAGAANSSIADWNKFVCFLIAQMKRAFLLEIVSVRVNGYK